MTTMEIMTIAVTALVALSTGALAALKAVAPHTQTKLDDKLVEAGDKVLPVMVRVLEWLRGPA